MKKDPEPVLPSQIAHPIVGIGASAGGLRAMLEFFGQLPEHSGMSFVVVQHLAPDHESNLPALLQKVTPMRVVAVTDTVAIEKDSVYLISPALDLTMFDDHLRVHSTTTRTPARTTIDLFFRTLADAHRERSVGVVLSGGGADGSLGLARLKERGGMTFAQDPLEAEHDSMPRSAIGTGMVDFVLPVAQIARKLVELRENATEIKLPPPDEDDDDSELALDNARALHEIMVALRTRTAHDFRHYKRATVLRRLERRMQVNGIADVQGYRDFLQQHPDETFALLQDMLISVTNFFRDTDAFDLLARDILPAVCQGRAAQERVRVWSAGCATGEEAYSLAMLLQEASARTPEGVPFQVFATDIDERAISTARNGLYPEGVAQDVSASRLRQFFAKEPGYYRIRKELRENMLFAVHNVLSDPPFSRLDVICCRNLLIYLDREAQIELLRMFHFALRPGGYLFLGSSESADSVSTLFTPVDKRSRIYRANMAVRSDTTLPVVVAGALGTRRVVNESVPAVRRKYSYGELHQALIEQFAPPSVLVNRDSAILHVSDRAGRFLQYAAGEPSHNVVNAVWPELRLELRTLIYQVFQTNRSVEARRVPVERGGRRFFVNMTARPVHDADAGADYILVLFDEVENLSVVPDAANSADAGAGDSAVDELERELQRTKEQLQATIEQSETSTEELKASNEELQAINEELRSASEELETSKEELQSINEELTTVNAELKAKVEETGKINDDLQNLIAANDVATIFVDRNMCIKRYTPRATEVFSIIASDIGRSLLDITHRLEYDRLADDAAEAFDSLRMIERELRSTGGRWYLARFVPYRTTEDVIDGAVLSFIDISARRNAEERLREGEKRMRIAAASIRDYAIITFDDDALVTSWNAGAERIFGYREAEMLGRSAEILFTDEDRASGAAATEFRVARERGRSEDNRWHLRKDGQKFRASGVLTRIDDGGVRGFAKIARNLDEEQGASADVTARRGQRDAERRRDEFLAVVSHELKHPLNLISGNIELIARSNEAIQNPRLARAADTIRRTVVGQAQIIDDLLDMSRVRTGKLSIMRSAVDWRDAVERICGAARDEAAQRNLTLSCVLPDEPVIVHADLTRVEQIVWNLVSNALKFTDSGGRIDVSLRTTGPRDATLIVKDTGSGIGPDVLPHIFDMFEQTRVSKQRRGGLGIGLALVRELVTMHGGQVRAKSAGPGEGSTFEVSLPLRRTLVDARAETEQEHVSLAGMKILLVDDDAATVETFKLLLEAEGARVDIATGARAALDRLNSDKPDVILSDLGMPGMDGFEFMAEVRRRPGFETVRSIALSGFGQAMDVEKAQAAGFTSHLTKPVMLDDLLTALTKSG